MQVREIVNSVMAEMEAAAAQSFDFVMAPSDGGAENVRPANEAPVEQESAGVLVSPVQIDGDLPGRIQVSEIPENYETAGEISGIPEVSVNQVGVAEISENGGELAVERHEIPSVSHDGVGVSELPSAESFSTGEIAGFPEPSPPRVEQTGIVSADQFVPLDPASISGAEDSSVSMVNLPEEQQFQLPDFSQIAGDPWSPQSSTEIRDGDSWSPQRVDDSESPPEPLSVKSNNDIMQPSFHEIAEEQLQNLRANVEEMLGQQMERMSSAALDIMNSVSSDLAMRLEGRHRQ